MRCVLLLIVGVLGLGCERAVLYWMMPGGPFDPGQLPAPPDYAAPAEPPLFAPGFASAQCQGGRLVVSLTGRPPRDFMSRLLDRTLGPGNYHPIEYQLFFADIRESAAERLRTWLSSRASAR